MRSNRVDLDAVAAAIDALDVDVVAVQEVDRGLPRSGELDQVAELASLLGRTGVFAPALLGDPTLRWIRGPGADPDPGGPAYGIGLISRLPLTTVAISALPGGGPGKARRRRPDARRPPIPYRDGEPRAALRVTVEAPWGPVAVTTAHLSFVPWRGRRQLATVGGFAHGGPDGTARRGAPRRSQFAAADGRAGLCGAAAGGRCLPGRRSPRGGPVAQLDHVLVRGALVMDDLTAGPAGPSDHLPLTATLRQAG